MPGFSDCLGSHCFLLLIILVPQGEGDEGLEEDRDGEGDGGEDGGDVQVLLYAQCWLQGERVRT